VQPLKNFPAFYGTRRFNTVFTRALPIVGNKKQKFMESVNDFISPIGYVKYTTQEFQKYLRTIDFLPLYNEVSVKSKQEIEYLIARLASKAHQTAVEAARLLEHNRKHSWAKALRQHGAAVINHNIVLYTDVYNYSTIETPPAPSWPARSLTRLRAQCLRAQVGIRDWEISFAWFSSTLHRSGCVLHNKNLKIIREMRMKKFALEF
jgi:hypothetical protein